MKEFMQATPGITEPKLTLDPLGTEGEMTPGPDDENPYDDPNFAGGASSDETPTEGDDPYLFDDVGDELEEGFRLPPIGNGPRF